MSIKLGDNIEMTGPVPNDARYLNVNVPWASTSAVNAALLGGTGGVRYTGLTVNIDGSEYWYKDGIADIDLIEKTSGGGGGSGLLNWTGSTANAIGTYMSVSGICAQPNLKFDGNTLDITGNIALTGNVTLKTGNNKTIGWDSTAVGIGNCLFICGNNAAATSVGGKVCIIGGAGGATSGNGGLLYLFGGCATSGNAGPVGIWGGHSNNGFGGSAFLRAGASTNANGSNVSITGGDSIVEGYYGGHVGISGGKNQSLTCTAGNITIAGGSNLDEFGPGGNVYLCGGGNEGDGLGDVFLCGSNINILAPSGMTYVADYSVANENNPRWIPDAGWVTGNTGDVAKVGTPLVCQVAVWTGNGTVCGGTTLKMTNNQLCITGSVYASTNVTTNTVYSDYVLVPSGHGCVVLDSDEDGFAHIMSDNTGSYCGWDACSFVLASAGADFYFVEGETNQLIGTCAGIVNADTCFVGSGAGLTGTAASLSIGGTANNASCLGGQLAANYLRSNVADSKTSGTLTFNDNVTAQFGSTSSFTIMHDGTHTYIDSSSGSGSPDVYIRNNGGEGISLIGGDGSTNLFNSGAPKLSTLTTGVCVYGQVKGTCFVGSGAGLTGTAASLTAGNATNAVSKTVIGTNSFTPGYLTFSDGGAANRDFIAYNDTTNAFYFNADTTHITTTANACIYAANVYATCFCGKAYDADRLDGLNSSTAAGASTIMARTSACDVAARLFCSTYTSTNATIGSIMTKNTTDTYIRPSTPAQIRAGVTDGYYLAAGGCAVNSQLLDSLDSSCFLRSSAADQKTSGTLRFNDNVKLTLGTGNDLEIYHDGANSFINDVGTGNFYIRNAGTNQVYISNTCVQLYNTGIARFKTLTTGTYTTGTHCATTCLRTPSMYASTIACSPIICGTTRAYSPLICVNGSAGVHLNVSAACGSALDWIATSDCRIKKCI